MLSHTSEFPLICASFSVRRLTRWILVLVASALLAILACMTSAGSGGVVRRVDAVADSNAPGTPVSVGLRFSHNGRYRAEVEGDAPLAIGEAQSWTVRLMRRNHRRVAHAHVAVRAWMPETGERSPVQPSVSYVGGGRYRLDGIYFSRPGWWNVALAVDGPNGIDSVAFNVILPSPQAR